MTLSIKNEKFNKINKFEKIKISSRKNFHHTKIIKNLFPNSNNENNKSMNNNSIINKKINNSNSIEGIYQIFHTHEIKIISNNFSNNDFKKLYIEQKQINEKLIERDKENKKEIVSMLQELNNKDLLIENLRKELFKYQILFNKKRDNENLNIFKKEIKILEKRNKNLNVKLNLISKDINIINTFTKKYQVEKFSFDLYNNLKKENNENKLLKEKNFSNTFCFEKNNYDKYFEQKDNNNSYKLSNLNRLYNNLTEKYKQIQKEKYDLDNIILKQEEIINELNNKLGIMKKKEVYHPNNYLKNNIDKYREINYKSKNKFGPNLFNSFNNSFNLSFNNNLDKHKKKYPIIKLNLINKRLKQNQLKQNNSDFYNIEINKFLDKNI